MKGARRMVLNESVSSPMQQKRETLQANLAASLVDVRLESGTYSLLDFPDYSNLGDSAIWVGACTFLKQKFGKRPDYISSLQGFSADEHDRLNPSGPIFLSGGGNFGDLWPRFQRFRLEILKRYPDREIIQLPQTIHFESEEALHETAAAIRDHGRFRMLVRDRRSLAVAQAFGCPTALAPDLAFFIDLRLLQRVNAPSTDILFLLRSDKERNAARTDAAELAGKSVVDWIRYDGSDKNWQSIKRRVIDRLIRRAPMTFRYALCLERSVDELRRGVAILSEGRTLVTDRLHGHILGLLVQLPTAILDNSYGKISSFAECWTNDLDEVYVASSLQEAQAWCQSVLDRRSEGADQRQAV